MGAKFAYAFEFLDREESEDRIMHLTLEEFHLLVTVGMHPNQSAKALAYKVFRWDDERIKRIPFQQKDQTHE